MTNEIVLTEMIFMDDRRKNWQLHDCEIEFLLFLTMMIVIEGHFFSGFLLFDTSVSTMYENFSDVDLNML